MKPLVFIHIPKAGGKSFEKLLLQNYPDARKVIRMYRMPKQELGEVFAKVPRQKIEHFELIYGHIPHRIEQYIGRPCDYITMLREPVERFLSFYRYVKYDFTAHPWHARLNSGELTLLNLISETNNNRMTKMLAGIDVNEPPTPSMLEDAKRNLMMMPVFGLLERYNESCLLIANKLHWPSPFYIKTNMSSDVGRHEVIDDETLAKIASANSLDVQLYDYAQTLFEQMVQAESTNFAEVLQSYSILYRDKDFASGSLNIAAPEIFPDHLRGHLMQVNAYLHANP